jgi:tRNA-splicing ligase RtcB (3'-phosphate/5'-hydroxy nucleic acid ligase)
MKNENSAKPNLNKISDVIWEFPKTGKMNVPARIYGNEKIINSMDDGVYDQIKNVATLPGIVNHAFCMPDGHISFS